VVRTVREDPRNRDVLYLGTELGLFISSDRGARWMPLGLGMPTVAVYDMVVHPRENDLVLATHGRGVWILDNVNPLQELTGEIASRPAHLFTLEPADQIRYADETAHSGDMIFNGQNPPAGAIIDYYLRDAADSTGPAAPVVTVLDGRGREIARVPARTAGGVNRVTWNLRYADIYRPAGGGQTGGFFGGGGRVQGAWVLPGRYTVRLTAGDVTQEQALTVRNDPRIDVSPGELVAWHDTLVSLGELIRHTAPLADSLAAFKRRVDSLPAAAQRRQRQLIQELSDITPKFTELKNRQIRLYREMDGWLGRPTTDQLSELAYYRSMVARYEPRVRKAVQTRIGQ
jgi:hypothetical protein